MRRIHLDTDIGGDTDDLCALAMLLGWPGVELVGVTTCSDSGGLRAGLARYALRLAGQESVPVMAGADGSLGGYRVPPGFSDLDRYWPEPVAPEPSPPGAALDLLARSVEMGATIVGVGPWTNLALLEVMRPGLLASTQLIVLGGYVRAVGAGLLAWEPDMDYNVQQDTLAARIVWERCDPLVVQPSLSLEASLCEAHLPRLREGGALARLIARQGELYGADEDMRRVGREHPRLPDDLLNFQYDPLACAVAAGWDGARGRRATALGAIERWGARLPRVPGRQANLRRYGCRRPTPGAGVGGGGGKRGLIKGWRAIRLRGLDASFALW